MFIVREGFSKVVQASYKLLRAFFSSFFPASGFVQTSNISTLTWFVFIVCCPAADPVFCVLLLNIVHTCPLEAGDVMRHRKDPTAAYDNPNQPPLQLDDWDIKSVYLSDAF